MDVEGIYKGVSERYSSAANFATSARGNTIAQAFGYTEKELSSDPEGSNLGLSCGNPLAIATLREVYFPFSALQDYALTLCQGETVIDLGSGAGFDVFLASEKLGSSGKAIGIDMNKVRISAALTGSNLHAVIIRTCLQKLESSRKARARKTLSL